MIVKYSLLLIIFLQLHAFEDSDIDGVSDEKDLCPDTSFEDTVDEDGCPENRDYWGKISLSGGVDINIDDSTTSDYSLMIDYSYKRWSLSLYDSLQSYETEDDSAHTAGDLYLSGGRSFKSGNLFTKLTIGSKIAIGGSEVSSGENDYYVTLNLNYIVSSQIALLSQMGYTVIGEDNESDFENPLGYSVGVGYTINSRWYTSLLYQHSNSIYIDSDDYHSVLLFGSYNFGDNLFSTFSYLRGLDTLSYDQVISLKLGVNFE